MNDNVSNFEKYKFYVMVRVLAGSRAYGLHTETSDWDWRGFYAAPTVDTLGINDLPEQIEVPRADEVYWDVKKFCKLLLANNPNVLEVLYSLKNAEYLPFISTENSERENILSQINVAERVAELYANRHRIISKRCISTFGGYATSQLERGLTGLGYASHSMDLKQVVPLHQRDPQTISGGWKHLSHLIRLLISSISILETGELHLVLEGKERDIVLAIKNKAMPIEDVLAWHRTFEMRFQKLKTNNNLREEPDTEWVDHWLKDFRLAMI